MGFQQFLATHVVMDYIWEIFKGVSPTIIALITIAINYRLGKRKEIKEQRKKDIKELQDKIVGIIPYIVRNGAYLLEMIQNVSNQAEHDKFWTMYSEENTKMLTVAREYQAYEKIQLIGNCDLSEKCRDKDVLGIVSQYAYDLQDILDWYNEKAGHTDIKYFDDLCDEVKVRCTEAERKAENDLIEYSRGLGKDVMWA